MMRRFSCTAILIALCAPAAAAEMPFEEAWKATASYEYGQDMAGLLAVEREVIRAMGSPETRAACAARLAGLLEAEGTTPAGRQFLCLQLRQIGTPAEVPVLARLLAREDTSQMARLALEAIPGEASLQVLRAALNSLEGELRLGIIQSLAARRDEAAVAELIKLAGSADPADATAAAAVWALGNIGGPAATDYLQARAADAPGPLAIGIAVPLLRCADHLAKAGEKQRAAQLYELLSRREQPAGIRRAALAGQLALQETPGDPQQAAATILAWFAGDDPQQREIAAARLGALGDEQLEGLASQQGQLPDAARAALLELLALRGSQQARPMILQAAASDNPQLRRAGIRAMGLLGDPATIPSLIDALGGESEVSAAAQQALAAMPRQQIETALLAALKDRPAARPAVIELLKGLKCYEAIDPLIEIARDDDPAVYEIGLDGLRGIADPDSHDVPRLLRLLAATKPGKHRDEVEKTVLIVCEKLPAGQDRAVPVLAALPGGQAAAPEYLPLLGRLGGPQAKQIITASLSSSEAAVKDAAVRGLCNWPDATVAEQLMDLASDSANRAHQQWALRAYVRVVSLPSERPEAQTLEMLQAAMQRAEQPDDKRLILARAGTVRTMAAVDWLAGYLDQPELAQTACESIVELAHHRFLRQPNMARFRPLLERVASISRNAEIVERAKRYQLGL